jgi:hypothetical protein
MVSLLVKIDPFVGSLFSFGDEVLQFLVKKSRCNEAITNCEGYTFSPFSLYHDSAITHTFFEADYYSYTIEGKKWFI